MLTAFPIVVFALIINLLVPCALLCILQYILAKLESPWPGRVLPILSGTASVLMFLMIVLNIAAADGWGQVLSTAVVFLLVMNIPTVLFLVIYRVTRSRQIEKKDMDRMNIQDLE